MDFIDYMLLKLGVFVLLAFIYGYIIARRQ